MVTRTYCWSMGHKLKGQPLVEFAHAQDLGGGAGTELRVKVATLRIKSGIPAARAPLI
jgi:hypothetical protein